jgi:hypothetical protein
MLPTGPAKPVLPTVKVTLLVAPDWLLAVVELVESRSNGAVPEFENDPVRTTPSTVRGASASCPTTGLMSHAAFWSWQVKTVESTIADRIKSACAGGAKHNVVTSKPAAIPAIASQFPCHPRFTFQT